MHLKRLLNWTFLLTIIVLSWNPVQAQNDKEFNPDKLWDPLFYPQYGNEYRSASGAPGPAYWQNRADYQIEGTLDARNRRFKGEVIIDYTNNSPDKLDYVWLQLDQNSGEADSRSIKTGPHVFDLIVDGKHTDGFEMESVVVSQNGKSSDAEYIVDDTRMQIRLDNPVEPKGGKLQIKIKYEFDIPRFGARMGWVDTDQSIVYDMGQWYPRMAVYDDIMGWNTLPYLGVGEFYLEYGDIDYKVTVPASMVVAGSGELLNPGEVLTSVERERLDIAYQSDETTTIHGESDIRNIRSRLGNGMLTWHFRCELTRDVAWTASDAFIWDAARINLPNGKTALAQSLYPPQADWARSTEFIKAVIEHFSEWLDYPFPYPVATNTVAGWGGGMEYPGIVFNSIVAEGSRLFGLVNHEFGHTWFPMIVGSNERRHMWQDEGTNSFINDELTRKFNDGEFYNPRFQRAARPGMFDDDADPIIIYADGLKSHTLGLAGYGKPALGLKLLREEILGKERFDYAFKQYIKNWAYKHPGPYDFFRSFENAGGEDLSWFWNGFYFNNYAFDVAVDTVLYESSRFKMDDIAVVKIKNEGQMALPLEVKIIDENGRDTTAFLPAEIWRRGGNIVVKIPVESRILTVILDPEERLPDVNRDDNFWDIRLIDGIPDDLDSRDVLLKYIEAVSSIKKAQDVKEIRATYRGMNRGEAGKLVRRFRAPDYYSTTIYEDDNPIDSIIIKKKDIQRTTGISNQDVPDVINNTLTPRHLILPELEYLNANYERDIRYMVYDGKLAIAMDITSREFFKTTNIYDIDTGLKLRSSNEFNGLGQFESVYTYGDEERELALPDFIYMPTIRSFYQLDKLEVK